MNIELKILDKEFYIAPNLPHTPVYNYDLPRYETMGSAGMDLRITRDVYLHPGRSQLVGTGVAIHIGSMSKTTGWHDVAGFIYPRSGLGNQGVILGNGVGVIDQDYTGEIKLSLLNRTSKLVHLYAGDRVAQLVFQPIIRAGFNVVDEFTQETERGVWGFGSSGK